MVRADRSNNRIALTVFAVLIGVLWSVSSFRAEKAVAVNINPRRKAKQQEMHVHLEKTN